MSGIKDDYRTAGFGARLGFGARPALLIVDFVRAYVEPGSPLFAPVEPALVAARRLLGAARSASIPILHSTVRYAKGGVDGGVFFRKVKALAVFAEGAPGNLGAFAPGLQPNPDETVVVKQYASAFFGTSLASTLTARGVDTVILSGVSTSGCIRATAVDACQHGFVPLVVREAVGDRNAAVHDANLFDIDAKYGDVIGLEEALHHLQSLRAEQEGSD